MKKILIKLLICFWLLFCINNTFAINFSDASVATSKFWNQTIDAKSWTMTEQIIKITTNVFHTLKVVIWWMLVIYMVYAWIMLIASLWDDDEKITSSKRSIWYAIVWLIFVNIPWSLYSILSWKKTTEDVTSASWSSTTLYENNLFMNSSTFWPIIWNLITFLQIILAAFAIFVIVFSWIKMMLAQWKEEEIKSARSKIINSILGLIFLWILEAWRSVVFVWDLKVKWQNLFATLANLALYFAWPVAIFFLSMAWYYYITSGWNDDKVKKAKSIVFNTLLATLILIWMYTFFDDLKTLTFN